VSFLLGQLHLPQLLHPYCLLHLNLSGALVGIISATGRKNCNTFRMIRDEIWPQRFAQQICEENMWDLQKSD